MKKYRTIELDKMLGKDEYEPERTKVHYLFLTALIDKALWKAKFSACGCESKLHLPGRTDALARTRFTYANSDGFVAKKDIEDHVFSIEEIEP